jgi:hypothetical protein
MFPDPPERLALEISNRAIWNPYPDAKHPKLSGGCGVGAARTVKEFTVYAAKRLTDCIDSTGPKFIIRIQPLNDQT